MRIAAEISQYLFGPAEWRLGIDDPVGPSELIEPLGKRGGIGEVREIAKEAQAVCREASSQLLQKQAAEQPRGTRTGRKKPGRQATQRVRSGEGPPPGTTQWTCGWCCRVWPQVWSTAVTPS